MANTDLLGRLAHPSLPAFIQKSTSERMDGQCGHPMFPRAVWLIVLPIRHWLTNIPLFANLCLTSEPVVARLRIKSKVRRATFQSLGPPAVGAVNTAVN